MPKLTLKQQRFITAYLKTGNATEAVRQSYGSTDNATAAVIAYENLRKPNITQAIEKALLKAEVSPEWIVSRLRDEATSEKNHGSERIKALENLAKYHQLTGFTNQPQNLFTGAIEIRFGGLAKPLLTDSQPYLADTVIDQ